MSDLMHKAIEALNERGQAVAADGTMIDEQNVRVRANPDQFARAMLSGFVPTEEADACMRFLNEATEAIRHNWMINPSRASRDALVKTTLAQMILVGVVLGRGAGD